VQAMAMHSLRLIATPFMFSARQQDAANQIVVQPA
jgi:hypothetical protein